MNGKRREGTAKKKRKEKKSEMDQYEACSTLTRGYQLCRCSIGGWVYAPFI